MSTYASFEAYLLSIDPIARNIIRQKYEHYLSEHGELFGELVVLYLQTPVPSITRALIRVLGKAHALKEFFRNGASECRDLSAGYKWLMFTAYVSVGMRAEQLEQIKQLSATK